MIYLHSDRDEFRKCIIDISEATGVEPAIIVSEQNIRTAGLHIRSMISWKCFRKFWTRIFTKKITIRLPYSYCIERSIMGQQRNRFRMSLMK